jgi:hypothetical protein
MCHLGGAERQHDCDERRQALGNHWLVQADRQAGSSKAGQRLRHMFAQAVTSSVMMRCVTGITHWRLQWPRQIQRHR